MKKKALISRSFSIVVLIIALIFLNSCARKGVVNTVKRFKEQVNLEVEEVSSSITSETEFIGIESIAKENNGHISLLMVHGVREKTERHWEFFKTRLSDELGWVETSNKSETFGEVPAKGDLGPLPWKLVETTFTKPGLEHEIHVKEIFWYPITTRLKEYINNYDASIYRTGLAKWLKKEVFLDSFVDFALYSNEKYRALMKNTITTTFQRMEEGRETVVVAGGLGGQLIIDWMGDQRTALNRFRECIRQGHEISRIREVINQTPNCSVKLNILSDLSESAQKSDLIDLLNRQMPVNKRSYFLRNMYFISNHLPFTSMFTFTEKEVMYILSLPTKDARFAAMDKLILQALKEFSVFLSEDPVDDIPVEAVGITPKDDILTIVSFFDASDPFGFYLPNSAGDGVKVINARRQNAAVWEFDSHETIKALKSIPLVNLDGAIYSLIDESKARQKLQLRVDGAQEDARSDTLLVSAILSGVSDQPHVMIKSNLFEAEPDEYVHREPRKRIKPGKLDLVHKIVAAGNVTGGGLVSPFQNPSVEIDSSFKGIKEQMKGRELTQIMTIHGMRSKKPNHNDDMIFELAEELGFYLTPINEKVTYVGHPEVYGDSSSIRSITFQNQNGQELIFHTIYWSPMTTVLKDWLKERSNLQASTRVTQLLKREIIADGLGDVAVAINGQNSMFQEVALEAMLAVDDAGYQQGKSSLNFLLSGSLGSWLMYDFIKDYYVSSAPKPHESVVYRVFDDMPEWYLFTNQINLIGFTQIGSDFISPEDYEDNILFKKRARDGAEFKTQMIGFNDPNDILSYKLPSNMDDQKILTTNVYLNSTGGLTLNMDNVVQYAKWIDDILLVDYTHKGKDYFLKRKPLEIKQKAMEEACDNYAGPANLKPSACNFISKRATTDFYKEQKRLYRHKRNLLKELKNRNPQITNSAILDSLAKKGLRYELTELRRKDYLMKKKNYKLLCKPGLVMSALRSFATGESKQDLVVDFATAHEGPDNNHVLLRLIANGPEKVNKTFRPQPK